MKDLKNKTVHGSRETFLRQNAAIVKTLPLTAPEHFHKILTYINFILCDPPLTVAEVDKIMDDVLYA